MTKRICIIKHGALGDFFIAQGALASIRKAHADDHITLLTTPDIKNLAQASGFFDDIMLDTRSRSLGALLALRKALIAKKFDFVYDLQGSNRTSRYFKMLWPHRPNWSGPAAGCSHPRREPDGIAHRADAYALQLESAGLKQQVPPDNHWMTADITKFHMPDRFALLSPSCSPHRPEKRWTAEGYTDIANHLNAMDITPVLLGTEADRSVTAGIAAVSAGTIDLTGQTTILEIGALARKAIGALGNDTGPMHITAFAGCPTLVLFSKGASDPRKTCPRGPRVSHIIADPLAELSSDQVWDEFQPMMPLDDD